ncbi:hypothetical protein [Ferrimonas pelagia]|uniref:hypothetical protein n=1 Tax=Ferrimonas pelagia TaxID=1177826 RepID=UPI0031F07E48
MRNWLLFFLCIFPVATYANVVWPALELESRLLSWWPICVGLIVEFFFVRRLLCTSTRKAIEATVAANIVSAVLGIVLIPIGGFVWEILVGVILYKALGIGTFNPITWTATFLIACAVNVLIEGVVYRRVFKLNFKIKSHIFLWFMLANSISVGIAMFSLYINPIEY